MNITAQMVKDLRESTGAGMMDCKRALEESNGDMEKAIDYLREKGISKALKKASRIAAEGISNIYIDGDAAVIIEINSETDFVAKNEEFKALVDTVGSAILKNKVSSLEEALELHVGDQTVNELIVNATAKIGEKLSLRRFTYVEKSESEIFGFYSHMGGKISSLVVLKGADENVAKDIAMQSAAMKALYISREEVSESEIEHERSVLTSQVIEEGKDKALVEKIVLGKLNKFYEEICLNEQFFVKDSDIRVSEFLKQNNASVVKMVRYEVGEGMEKRNDNFAEEVMNQIK